MATHRIASYAKGKVELWLTPCIVSMPPTPTSSSCGSLLLVPSNERLCGTQFSHFPVGGPTPHKAIIGENKKRASSPSRNTQNKISERIIYASETVDGTLTELLGTELREYVQRSLPNLSQDDNFPIRCPTGSARKVPSVGILQQNFDAFILAVAPFWGDAQWHEKLLSAYLESFALAAAAASSPVVGGHCLAVPLLGAGARGAPVEEACHVAAKASRQFWDNIDRWQHADPTTTNDESSTNAISSLERIQFAVQDEDVAEVLDSKLLEFYPETLYV